MWRQKRKKKKWKNFNFLTTAVVSEYFCWLLVMLEKYVLPQDVLLWSFSSILWLVCQQQLATSQPYSSPSPLSSSGAAAAAAAIFPFSLSLNFGNVNRSLQFFFFFFFFFFVCIALSHLVLPLAIATVQFVRVCCISAFVIHSVLLSSELMPVQNNVAVVSHFCIVDRT